MSQPIELRVEVDGIPVLIDRCTFNDFRFLGYCASLEDGNATDLYRLATMLFGKEQLENVISSIESDHGQATVQNVGEFVRAVIEEAAKALGGDVKN